MSTQEVSWLDAPWRGVPRDGTVAWLTELTDPANAAWTGLAPTVADRSDGASRSGPELERFFARRSLLRHLVARRLAVPPDTIVVRYGEHGQPTVAAPGGLFCSVAARREFTGLAVSAAPVGLDLEPLEPGPIPWPMLTEAEADGLRRLPQAEHLPHFLALWTMKEAYVKAAGQGLNIDPATVAISARGGRRAIVDAGRIVPLAAIGHRQISIGQAVIVAACMALAD